MSRATSKKKRKSTVDGQVYVLKIWIGDVVYYKVGTTNRTALCRLKEIGVELMTILGYWPKMKIMLQKFTRNNYQVEAEILKETLKYRPVTVLPDWSGCTELRMMDEQELETCYHKCMAKDYEVVQARLIQL